MYIIPGQWRIFVGTINAVKSGVLDNPFAINSASPCKAISIKDGEGTIRYLDHGNVPLTKDILEFHRSKLAERRKLKKGGLDYETLVNDLSVVSKDVNRIMFNEH